MRAIDADALIEELNASHYPGAPYVDAGISIAIGKVCDAPTIESPAHPEHDENDLDFVQTHKRIPVQLVVSSDCISRQAAIDALCELCGDRGKCNCDICPDVEVFQLLPSAQPERTEIIRCKDCNKASKCYGDVIMRSRGGGNIYCPLEFCSEAERRTDERPD